MNIAEFQAVVRIKDFLLQKVNSLKKPKSGLPVGTTPVGGWFETPDLLMMCLSKSR